MTLAQEYVTEVRIAAHACDDYTTHRQELAYADMLQRKLDKATGRMTQSELLFPTEKRLWSDKSHRASSVSEALQIMERLFG